MTMQKAIEMSDAHFSQLCTIIHENTGITIVDGRKSMLLSRLRGRLRELGETDFDAYISRVTSDRDEMQELVNRVTTNKTLFYRTPRVWEHFRTVVVEEFLASGTRRPMRVWSAASSTGQEAHTAGMVLESVRHDHPSFDYKVIGTDISKRVLDQAEAGVFSEQTVANFKKDQPELFTKHMMRNDAGTFQVSPDIKSRISFKYHNLQERMKNVSSFDAVFLRNVLIYFTIEDQAKVLAHIHALLPPNGTLYIGESESLSRVETDFDIVEPMVYRPQAGARKADA